MVDNNENTCERLMWTEMMILFEKDTHANQGWASVLFKRTEQSLRSSLFFIKEQNNLCVLFRS